MMPLIERYVLKRALRVFFLTLCALVATLWVTQVLRKLDVVTAKGQAIWTFLVMTFLALPELVQVVAPIAFLVAAIVTLNALTGDSELPVIAAAGASRATVNRPIVLLGFFVMLGVSFSYHVVSPASLAVLHELSTRLQANLIASLVEDGGFRTVDQGLTMHIREKAPDGTFRDIFVNDDRNPNESVQYSASHGVLLERDGNSYLVLQNGDLVRQDHVKLETNVVNFDTYALDLGQLGPPSTAAIFKARQRSTLYLLDPDPADSSLTPDSSQVAFELHNRLSAPLYTLAFAFIALAFLGRPRTNRQDRTFAIAACVLLCVLVRTVGFATAALAGNSAGAIPFLYAVPLSGVALGLFATLLDARLAMPRFLEAALDSIAGAFRRLRPAGAAAGASAYDGPA